MSEVLHFSYVSASGGLLLAIGIVVLFFAKGEKIHKLEVYK